MERPSFEDRDIRRKIRAEGARVGEWWESVGDIPRRTHKFDNRTVSGGRAAGLGVRSRVFTP